MSNHNKLFLYKQRKVLKKFKIFHNLKSHPYEHPNNVFLVSSERHWCKATVWSILSYIRIFKTGWTTSQLQIWVQFWPFIWPGTVTNTTQGNSFSYQRLIVAQLFTEHPSVSFLFYGKYKKINMSKKLAFPFYLACLGPSTNFN